LGRRTALTLPLLHENQQGEKQAIAVGELSPTAHLALQHNQLLS